MIIAYAGRSPLRNCLIYKSKMDKLKGYVDSWNEDAVHEGEEGECVVEKGD